MENEIFIDEFGYEMEEVQLEKASKYEEDSWKTVPIDVLVTKMNEQIKKIPTTLDKEKLKRIFIHIANYSFFLYNRLGE